MYRWTVAPNHQHQSKRRLQGRCSRFRRSWPTSCTCLSCWGEMGKRWLSCMCWDWSCVCVLIASICPWPCFVPWQPRSLTKQLVQPQAALLSLRGKVAVKAQTDEAYKKCCQDSACFAKRVSVPSCRGGFA